MVIRARELVRSRANVSNSRNFLQKQHEELDFGAAISALQWAAATVACTRAGYPKAGDIATPPVIRRLQLQSAALSAAAAAAGDSASASVGERRPRSQLYSPRFVRAVFVLDCCLC